ncbi:MAG TPA: alpha-2-macroglobulin family protein, partial [Roseiflexaceae bacterium]|nr:alpha-2-macroglobulin family protein [Roseiflexaceae bacterium]
QTITTDAQGAAVVRFTPTEGGSYRVLARTIDGGGREVRSSIFLWVFGASDISWGRDNNDRIDLIADRTRYTPGETASILIPSPFQGPHWALITIERGHIISHEVRQVSSNSIVYQLPISADHAPNVYVSVTLFSAPPGAGAPAEYKVGLLALAVEPVAQQLQVTLTASPGSTVAPGQAVIYDIQVRDAAGQPVAAELSLDVVDKAILTLQPRQPNAIGEAFYGLRPLAISTSAALSISLDRLLQLAALQQAQQAPPGFGAIDRGMVGSAAEAMPAPTAMPAAIAQRGDQATTDAPTVREQFADTAYWNGQVVTDAAGRAAIQVTLPDNLTTWVLRGVGVTMATQVGEGLHELIATKPLLIRPVTPRFFVAGDTAELAANVSNNSDSAVTAEVWLDAAGVTLTTVQTVTLQIGPRSEARATWGVQVPLDPGGQPLGGDPLLLTPAAYADLVFGVRAGPASDASRPRLASGPGGTLPIYRYSVPEVVGTGGQIEGAGARAEVIGLPPALDPTNGEVTVRMDPSLAAGLRDSLTYLENYPYESADAIVSRFLPNVLSIRALRQLGITDADLEQRLPLLVDQALSQLYALQLDDGGWGWWAREASNPHISAYVVFGMLKARESGFSVRDDALMRGLDYLAGTLSSTTPRTPADANREAWILFVLAESGRSDTRRMGELYTNRERLGVYGRAFLAMGLQRADAGDSRLRTLLSDLNTAAITSATGAHWEETERDWWSMGSSTRSTAIALAALVRLDPANQLNPNVVRWLMVARDNGIWATSQENAWSIIALSDWMQYTRELAGNYDYSIWLNGVAQQAGRVDGDTIAAPVTLHIAVRDLLRDTGNILAIGRGDGPGRLYYTTHLRTFLPVEQVGALDRGFNVTRRYVAADCTAGAACPELHDVALGSEIRVELELNVSADRYYVRLEDPLPAGAEAIDTSLATTSRLVGGPDLHNQGGEWGWWWYWRWYNRSELRDDRVVLFADFLPRGSYLYSYTMRATLPGEFRVIPATASESYFPEVYGRSDGRLLRVIP